MKRIATIGGSFVLGITVAALGATAFGAATRAVSSKSSAQFYALRLEPGQDIRQELQKFAHEQKLRAGFIASCTGSVNCMALRYANQSATTLQQGHYEIASLSGTLEDGAMHLHAAFSDSTGATMGGHLEDGSIVFTTAEIVVGELSQLAFARENDAMTGYRELVVRKR